MVTNADKIREEYSRLCHESWSNWMRYLFRVSRYNKITGEVIIPASYVTRWRRQMDTEYENLPEEEKKSDRMEAEKFIK